MKALHFNRKQAIIKCPRASWFKHPLLKGMRGSVQEPLVFYATRIYL
jgi:hypothetical protein